MLTLTRWKTHLRMPTSIHDSVHSSPSLRLHVVNTNRQNVAMDTALLTSPQLHSLEYAVYGSRFALSTPSEFRLFKNCLLEATNLRTLKLDMSSPDSTAAAPDWEPGELNLQFRDGDRFPPLESLMFSDNCYTGTISAVRTAKCGSTAWTGVVSLPWISGTRRRNIYYLL